MQSNGKSSQVLPKRAYIYSSIGKVKEATLRVSPKNGAFRDWKDFVKTPNDFPISNIAELKEKKAREYLVISEAEKEWIANAKLISGVKK
jgi:hypothetical protein